MGYEKFDPDKTDFIAIAFKYNGNASAIARHYNIAHDTIYQYMDRDPVGKGIIQTVRGWNTVYDMDLAEAVNRYNMQNFKSNPNLAQKAAEKTIDKKGHTRGWGVSSEQIIPEQSSIDMSDILMKQQARIAELEAQLESKQQTSS